MPEAGPGMLECNWSADVESFNSGPPFQVPPPPPWPQPKPADLGRQQRVMLAHAVELDIVPRLVLARRGMPDEAARLGGITPSVEAFAGLILGKDVRLAVDYADRACAAGMNLEALYLDLLAPAARHLGTLWDEDLVDFTQVTIGLGRLHRVLRDVTPSFHSGAAQPRADRRALLVPAPGEQHTFGLTMVTEFFRRAAWVVWSGAPATPADLVGLVRDNWFSVVGFSLGSEARLDGLRAGILRVRRASQNPCVGIMVGGPLFIEHPELVAGVGADATAADGLQAVAQAQSLLTLLPTRL